MNLIKRPDQTSYRLLAPSLSSFNSNLDDYVADAEIFNPHSFNWVVILLFLLLIKFTSDLFC